jgi:hypothetical protein
MSAHHILEPKQVPRVRLFADLKVVRELGLERRETVRSLSTVSVENLGWLALVRKDWAGWTPGVPVVCLEHRRIATSSVANR